MIENLLEGYFFDKTFRLVMTSLRASLGGGRGRGVSWAGESVSRAGGSVSRAGGAVSRAGGAVSRAGGAVSRAGGAVSWAGRAVFWAGCWWWGPWHPSAQKAAISGEHSTTGGLDVVPAVWADLRDYSVDVPSFGGVVLYWDMRTNVDLWESVGVLVVVLCDLFHVRGCLLVYLCCTSLPLSSVMRWQRVLHGVPEEFLRW